MIALAIVLSFQPLADHFFIYMYDIKECYTSQNMDTLGLCSLYCSGAQVLTTNHDLIDEISPADTCRIKSDFSPL